MNDDKKNRCYICGKDRAAVNYFIIFIIYIVIKDKLEL